MGQENFSEVWGSGKHKQASGGSAHWLECGARRPGSLFSLVGLEPEGACLTAPRGHSQNHSYRAALAYVGRSQHHNQGLSAA